MVAPSDSRDREMTPTEAAEARILVPVLMRLADYLGAVGAWGTLDMALRYGAPLTPRTHGSGVWDDPEYPSNTTPLYVESRTAWEWMCRQSGFDRAAMPPRLVTDAITFMGGREARTMHGRDEGDRDSPHRGREIAGWYRLSREMVARIMYGPHIPVLTPLFGRPAAGMAPERPAVVALRAGGWIDPDSVLRLIRAFLVDRAPTVRLRAALDEGRPLVPRRAGRPSKSGLGLDPRRAVVAVRALRAFSVTDGGRLNVASAGSNEAMRQAVKMAEDRLDGAVVIAQRANGADVRRDVVIRDGWLRCDLTRLGLGPWDADALRAELLDMRSRRLGYGSDE